MSLAHGFLTLQRLDSEADAPAQSLFATLRELQRLVACSGRRLPDLRTEATLHNRLSSCAAMTIPRGLMRVQRPS